MIYVEKDGFVEQEYNCTKVYVNELATTDEIKSANYVNSEICNISMQEEFLVATENAITSQTSLKAQGINKIYAHLIKEKQLTTDNPIIVLNDADYSEFQQTGIISQNEATALQGTGDVSIAATTPSSLKNISVPIGTFHVSKRGKLDVTFYTSDQLKVQVGVTNMSTGEVSVSGTRTRGFESTSEYAQFTTTSNGAKKTYYTNTDFEKWTTVSYYGLTKEYVGLKVIYGGTETGSVSECGTCAKAYANLSASNGDGTIVIVEEGSSYTVTSFRDRSVTLSSKVALEKFGMNLSVTRITGSKTKLKYSPKSGYNLKVYNRETNTWHCTHRAT